MLGMFILNWMCILYAEFKYGNKKLKFYIILKKRKKKKKKRWKIIVIYA